MNDDNMHRKDLYNFSVQEKIKRHVERLRRYRDDVLGDSIGAPEDSNWEICWLQRDGNSEQVCPLKYYQLSLKVNNGVH